ncbi:hypothetical protein [Faecalimicrobium dakarense]|uniref:hypothetical protein n=1 Tax=Faecalimicrobium dakarense TaxID=1301100 RepID=UPI0005A92A09|nr:hypothetical protein [[Clostridium] dakarense]
MTLVEVVITISIMLIISSLCFPKDSVNKHQINLFTKQLCSDIRYVRKANMLGNLKTYIYYFEDNKSTSYIVRENGKDLKKVHLPSGANIQYGNSKVKFKPDGSPDPKGQTINIYKDNLKIELTIVPVSGRVLLKEGKYET